MAIPPTNTLGNMRPWHGTASRYVRVKGHFAKKVESRREMLCGAELTPSEMTTGYVECAVQIDQALLERLVSECSRIRPIVAANSP